MAITISPNGRVAFLSDEETLEVALNGDISLPSLFKINSKGAKFNVFGINGSITSPEVNDALNRYTGLTQTEIDAITVFVTAEVANGNWGTNASNYTDSLYDCFFCFALVTEANGLTDMHQVLKLTAVNNGATKTADGFSFDGINDFLDSNFNPTNATNYSLDDALIGAFLKTVVSQADFEAIFGARVVAANRIQLATQPTATTLLNRINSSNALSITSQTFTNDTNYVLVRASSANTELFKDGVSIGSNTAASIGLPNENVQIGVDGANSFFDGTLSTFVAGVAVGFDQTGYNTNIVTLLTSLGVLP